MACGQGFLHFQPARQNSQQLRLLVFIPTEAVYPFQAREVVQPNAGLVTQHATRAPVPGLARGGGLQRRIAIYDD